MSVVDRAADGRPALARGRPARRLRAAGRRRGLLAVRAGGVHAVDGDGAIEGSITGGCVESDVVVERARDPRRRRRAARCCATASPTSSRHTVGLMCGGTVEVFVHELARRGARGLRAGVRGGARAPCATAIATLVEGPGAGAKLAVVGDARDRRARRARAARPHGRPRPAPRSASGARARCATTAARARRSAAS